MGSEMCIRDSSIQVLKADAPINVDLITTASSNFAPSTIAVKVIGEVALPGMVEIPSNTPLSQAILASGGLSSRASESRVDFDSDGCRGPHHDQTNVVQPGVGVE